MLRKSAIEQKIISIRKQALEIGFDITVLEARNLRVITELEKVDHFYGYRKKPNFISPKNYPGIRRVIGDNCHGLIFGIWINKTRSKDHAYLKSMSFAEKLKFLLLNK